jgi:hypothetical protein
MFPTGTCRSPGLFRKHGLGQGFPGAKGSQDDAVARAVPCQLSHTTTQSPSAFKAIALGVLPARAWLVTMNLEVLSE